MFFGLLPAHAQPACHAQFQHYSMPAAPDSVHFYPAQNSNTARFLWSFGDGTYSHNRDPWHRYAHAGSYVVCLTVSDSTSAGTCTDTWCDSVIVTTPPPPTCNAQFTYFAHQSHTDSLHFYPMQTQHSTTAHYFWSFGDGTGGHTRDPWHRYAHAGSYVVCLTVTDTTSAGFCTDTWCDTVIVTGAQAPICNAHFQHYSMPANPDSVHFYPAQNSSTGHYFWNFGDGTYSHNRDPWHLYAQHGTYIVCLTVTDTTAGGSCSDTWCDTVIVTGVQAPICNAQFTHYAHQSHADSLHFYPMQTQHSTTAHYFWSFGDGTGGHTRDPWHRYAQHGTYIVCLTVTDTTSGGSCSDTWCDTVTVTGAQAPICNAHFQHYSMPANPDSVHFYPAQNSSTGHYFWSFGDGTYSHNRDPWHRYAVHGTYVACLTVTDTTSGGVCSDTWCGSNIVVPFVEIYPNPANSVVSISMYAGSNPVTFQIHDEKGRVVSRTESTDGTFTVNSAGMSSGSYFYEVIENGVVIATGKFMVMKAD